MTKETETLGLVCQSENFNYNRYSNYIMDSWSFLENPVLDPNHSKPRLLPGDDLTAITMLYEQCKNQKDQKMTTSNRGSSVCKSTDRILTNTNELVSLESSANVMKILSENIPSGYPQEVLGSKQNPSLPVSIPTTSETYATLTSVMADNYDKQELNIIFDTLLAQKWPETGAFPDPSNENLPYSNPFPEEQSSPVYSGSYTRSPSERYRSEFQFSLGAPPAAPYKSSELPMVYLNKGQFYPITLHGVDSSASFTSTKVKTVVMAVFENDKSPEVQLRFWNHWHSRQPTIKQRVIDIADYKEVFSGISNIEEVAFNALSFVWNPNEEAKVYIGINSLSTDFSSQKGVKGQPLNLQIDTYDFSSGTNQLLHRAACQVKIFCDKGAERKMRDEERKRTKRRGKNATDANSKSLVSSSIGSECTFFQTLDDHVTQPVLFIPETHLSSLQRCNVAAPPDDIERSSLKRLYPDREQNTSPPGKVARKEDPQRVLMYVRTSAEEVFDALMLSTPTLSGLRQAISEKYGMQKDTIGKIYKKCKRGIFVNMDDNIIEHYTNQSAFLIEISDSVSGQFQVTLVEV
ncbi:grainyhead-like protein 3 homolog [Sphaeramia orbicularis]|uniref:Grh/CP2 DB domain-containing protein n=1 Tax=Sphaeramia orbicularis TaxID=375764 RepID=A0A672ZVU1_9TELE|nr:grainyhead-like protein 3 homolog [Sphaeramia orbicularis]XP_029983546.1 grainyhead-like protein 3 homolog [Sphaeramia orbicularis]XP_029983548.1 grainyhead-like protein 3 homolog [Sphaeramia orbicularis]